MSFKNCAFYDKIMPGKITTVKGISFIPIIGVTIAACGEFALFFYGCISPKGVITVESNGEISLYRISDDTSPSKLLESITLLNGEE